MTDSKKPAKTSTGKRVTTSAKGAVKAAAPAKKPALKTAAPVKAPAAKAVAPKSGATARPARTRAKKPAIGDEQRRNYIEVAAYYIAARRDFAPGDPMQDWVEAEAEIDRLLAAGRLGT